MNIDYQISTATNKLQLEDEKITEVPATSDLSFSIKGIPASMVDKFHEGIRDTLFEFGWDGSIK